MSDDEREIVWLGDNEALIFPPPESGWARKGWAAYSSTAVDQAFAQVFIRFGLPGNVGWDSISPDDTPALIIRETVVRGGSGGGAVTAALVRELPFARLEAAANRRLARLPRPDAGDLPFLNSDEKTRAPHFASDWAATPERSRRERKLSLKLRVPSDRKKPDRFYEQVAERFLWLTERGRKPAVELAAANGVPVTTVHRWVKEARRRGILPAVRRGDGATPREEEE